MFLSGGPERSGPPEPDAEAVSVAQEAGPVAYRKPSDRPAPRMSNDTGQAQLSRFLRAIDALTSKAGAAAAIALAVAAAVIGITAGGFEEPWTSAFSVTAAGITLVMVFVIQHTQSREQTATQLKLNEIIRALPQADDHLVHVEAGEDEELEDLERRHTAHHESLRAHDSAPRAPLAVPRTVPREDPR